MNEWLLPILSVAGVLTSQAAATVANKILKAPVEEVTQPVGDKIFIRESDAGGAKAYQEKVEAVKRAEAEIIRAALGAPAERFRGREDNLARLIEDALATHKARHTPEIRRRLEERLATVRAGLSADKDAEFKKWLAERHAADEEYKRRNNAALDALAEYQAVEIFSAAESMTGPLKKMLDEKRRANAEANKRAFETELEVMPRVTRPRGFFPFNHHPGGIVSSTPTRKQDDEATLPNGLQRDSAGRAFHVVNGRVEVVSEYEVAKLRAGYTQKLNASVEEAQHVAETNPVTIEQMAEFERERQAKMGFYVGPHPWFGWQVSVDLAVPKGKYPRWGYWRPTEDMAKATGRKRLEREVERAQRLFKARFPQAYTALKLRIIEPTQAEESAAEHHEWDTTFQALNSATAQDSGNKEQS